MKNSLTIIYNKRVIKYSRRGLFFEYLIKGTIKYSRRGLLGEIFDKLRIQGRMQIFEKMSQSALNQVLTLPDYRTQKNAADSSKNR